VTDIFQFWSQIKRGAHVHPADVKAFERMDAQRHGFQLDCLPGCFAGKLKTAPIVLLYLSPGFSPLDISDARSKDGQDYRFRSWQGDEHFVIMVPVSDGWEAVLSFFAVMKRSNRTLLFST
jgi:hypothetical protein